MQQLLKKKKNSISFSISIHLQSFFPLAEGKEKGACSLLHASPQSSSVSFCWACPLALLQVAQPLLPACVVWTLSPSHCWHADKASSAAAARTQLNYNAWPGQQHPELQNTPVIPQHDTRRDRDSLLDFLSETKIEPVLGTELRILVKPSDHCPKLNQIKQRSHERNLCIGLDIM